MTLVDTGRLIAAIADDWDEQCAGNRNEDACESCRAYAEVIRIVQRVAAQDTEDAVRP